MGYRIKRVYHAYSAQAKQVYKYVNNFSAGNWQSSQHNLMCRFIRHCDEYLFSTVSDWSVQQIFDGNQAKNVIPIVFDGFSPNQ